MSSYEYECKKHGIIEVEHSIKIKLTECPMCIEEIENEPEIEGEEKRLPCQIVRLISKSSFVLAGPGWAKDNYSK
jgi:hypothetical protein